MAKTNFRVVISLCMVFAQLWCCCLCLEDSLSNAKINPMTKDAILGLFHPFQEANNPLGHKSSSAIGAGRFRKMLLTGYCFACPDTGCPDTSYCEAQCCPRCQERPYTPACGGVYNCDECCAHNSPEDVN